MIYCPLCDDLVEVEVWRDVLNGDLEEYRSCRRCHQVLERQVLARNPKRRIPWEVSHGQ